MRPPTGDGERRAGRGRASAEALRTAESPRAAPAQRAGRLAALAAAGVGPGLTALVVAQSVVLVQAWRTGASVPPWNGGAGPDVGLAAAVLALLLLARSLRRPRARRRAQVQVRRLRAALAAASVRRRLAMAASVALVVATLDHLLLVPHLALQAQRTAALAAAPGLHHGDSNDHVPALLDLLARRADAAPVVVYPDSRDSRGHEAAYYAYPRLLLMEPGFRRWTLAARQLRCDALDPGFADPGPRPGVDASRAFARARGVPLVAADAAEAWIVPPEGDATHRGVWAEAAP